MKKWKTNDQLKETVVDKTPDGIPNEPNEITEPPNDVTPTNLETELEQVENNEHTQTAEQITQNENMKRKPGRHKKSQLTVKSDPNPNTLHATTQI